MAAETKIPGYFARKFTKSEGSRWNPKDVGSLGYADDFAFSDSDHRMEDLVNSIRRHGGAIYVANGAEDPNPRRRESIIPVYKIRRSLVNKEKVVIRKAWFGGGNSETADGANIYWNSKSRRARRAEANRFDALVAAKKG